MLCSALRLTIADRAPLLSAIYYATPPAILTCIAACLVIYNWIRNKPTRSVRLWIFAWVFWASWICLTEYKFYPQIVDDSDQQVLLWNLRNGQSGWDGVLQRLGEISPSIAVIIEGGRQPERFETEFPEYEITPLHAGMAILARGQISEVEYQEFANRRGKYLSAWVQASGHGYRIVAIDLDSDPLLSRRELIQAVADLAAQHAHEPLLIAGDFNTPRDSVHFRLLRRHAKHTWEAAGVGYGNTWPYPLPVLQLDHIWFNEHVQVSNCEHLSSLHSDHRIVLTRCRPRNPSNSE